MSDKRKLKSPARKEKRSLVDRIRDAWVSGITYHDLMRAVFPAKDYPNAWNYSTNGGPPACAMSFGKALKSIGLSRFNNRIQGTPSVP